MGNNLVYNTKTVSKSLIKLLKSFESNSENIRIIYLLNTINKLIEDPSIDLKKRNKLKKIYNTLINKFNLIICKVSPKECVGPIQNVEGINIPGEEVVINTNAYYFLETRIENVLSNGLDTYLTEDNKIPLDNLLFGTPLNIKGFGQLFVVTPKTPNYKYSFYDSLGNNVTNNFTQYTGDNIWDIYYSSYYYTTSEIYIKLQ